ncbi:MAG: Unknown protein [uncultured Sulfurovum sp.]|uniref:Uncharacterized protein n=1 Tax=uncultured Sulfurovum sp. TaxID=269237 RepID=A0A6S6SPM4_9BACT|nr:MAG: Unknown protein [uncultured Sulfurovum sp.]
MAIYKCDACHYIQETSNEYIGKKAKCPQCKEVGVILNTISYLQEVTEKNILLEKKLLDKDTIKERNTSKNIDNILQVQDSIPIKDFNIHNTDIFSQKDHYTPIVTWFKDRYIQAKVDPKMMDTTGFFDEVALYIGRNFNNIGSIVNQIKYIQNKQYDTVKINLSKNNNNEIEQIIEFCKMLHHYSFIARYNFQKKDKIIYLTLSNITKIKNFFNGLWMEWFVFIQIISFFKEKHMTLPIVRGMNITFQNKDKSELDIFFINNQGEPVCIECKTGEFRQDLNKYFLLQKKLNIKKEHFLLCVFGLEEEQAKGLTSMYEITLVNETTLIPHIKSLF